MILADNDGFCQFKSGKTAPMKIDGKNKKVQADRSFQNSWPAKPDLETGSLICHPVGANKNIPSECAYSSLK